MSQAKALQSMTRLLRISEYDAIAIACDISCQKGLAPLFKYNFLNPTQRNSLYALQTCITRLVSNR